jgi:hypothetical protein
MELAFPQIAQRNVHIGNQNIIETASPGYAIHRAILQNPPKGHSDTAPLFLDDAGWASFFNLVDSHKHINKTNIFLAARKYNSASQTTVDQPLAAGAANAVTRSILKGAKGPGVAGNRSFRIVSGGKGVINTTAGNKATKVAHQTTSEAAIMESLIQLTSQPSTDLPSTALPKDDKGLQVGTDDV